MISSRTDDGESFVFLHDALTASEAIAVASRLGIFERLGAAPGDVAAIARDCEISERGAAILLSALTGLGLVEAAGGGLYRPSPNWERLARVRPLLERLESAIRTGEPPVAANTAGAAQAFYPDVVSILADVFARSAEQVARHLGCSGGRVLDLGAGAAPWSLALTRRDPDCRVTALDLPAVIVATRLAVARAGRIGQYTFVGGDLFDVAWDADNFDLVVVGNVCHLFDELANRRLLAKAFGAVRLGGRIAIVDVLPHESLDGPRRVVLYALGLLLRTSTGGVYPFSTYVNWLRDTGFEAIERVDLSPSPPLTLITARRPA